MARHVRVRKAWMYKCRLRHEGGFSWVGSRRPGRFARSGWLNSNDRRIAEQYGGEKWIRSPASWIGLAEAGSGELVFCQQTDLKGLVGLTITASAGYPDPNGALRDKCSTIDLGPDRLAFDNVVTVRAIRQAVGELGAYVAGKSQHTFHAVEDEFVAPLLELCCKKNHRQRAGIEALAGDLMNGGTSGQPLAHPPPPAEEEIIRDPIRREMTIEAFERREEWARRARELYGYTCMALGCDFRLIEENGELYIEVHHLKPMCEGGSPNEETNLSVLCPNHHREAHYGQPDRRLIWSSRSRQSNSDASETGRSVVSGREGDEGRGARLVHRVH